jgi:hypothetical protein
LLDRFRLDGAERRHHDGDFAQLIVVEHAEDLGAVLFAKRQHEHRGAFRAAELADTLGRRRPLRKLSHQAPDILADGCFVLVFCALGVG